MRKPPPRANLLSPTVSESGETRDSQNPPREPGRISDRRIGRYTLESLLGRGGMGEVYKAYDERLHRHVAIKRIQSVPGDTTQRRARLEREARLIAQLAHPSIVQVFDIVEGAAEGHEGDWIVMELVEGRSLAALLEDGPIDVDTVLRYGRDIAAALAAAHEQGIIHRDLKVENVMVSVTGQVKILDFGIAKRLVPDGNPPGGAASASLSVQGQVLGTVRAMSPEQARGWNVDERSDLFSLGVLLYEALTNLSPFVGDTPMDTLLRVSVHRQTSLAHLPGMGERIPHALSELVDQLLEKACELRPASAAEVSARLQAIADIRSSITANDGKHAAPLHRIDRDPADIAKRPSEAAASLDWARLGEQETITTGVSAAAAPSPATRDETSPGRNTTTGKHAATSLPPSRSWLRARAGLAVLAAVAIVIGAGAYLWPGGSASMGAATGAAAPDHAGQPEVADAGSNPKAAYEQGMALLRHFHRPGAVDAAAAMFQRMLRQDERSAAGHAGLARAYWHKYVYTDASRDPMFLQQAHAVADRAVALDEFLADARVSRGLVALERGLVDAAETDFRAALAVEPGNADAYYGLAFVHQHHRRLDQAEAAFRKALERAPEARYLYDDLGALYVQRGHYQEAIPLFEKSIALAPDSVYGYSNLGAVYLLQGRYPEAAGMFQDALKIRPSASLYSNLGTVLFAQGLYGSAANAFERALAMGGAANHHLHWGNLADAYRHLPDSAGKAREHYDRAVQLIEAELARARQDQTLRSRRALYLAKGGNCERADGDLAALAEAADPAPYTLFRMAVALEICGHRQRAIDMLARALAAGFSAAEIGNDPELRALRADPGYHRVLGRLGTQGQRARTTGP